jgi:POT family proton-dependent oligopeptide transporter
VNCTLSQQPLPRGSRTGAGGHDRVSGALGRGIQAATGLTTFNQFWVYVIPLFGAYIADTKLGRYKTICWAVFIAMTGHVLLIVSSVPGVIEHPSGALVCFTLALIVMGLGSKFLFLLPVA